MQASCDDSDKPMCLGFFWDGRQTRKKNRVFGVKVKREIIYGKIER